MGKVAKNEVVVQVCRARDDVFRIIDRKTLTVFAQSVVLTAGKTLEVINQAFWQHSEEAFVSSTAGADCVLVLDGVEDVTSWKELSESLTEDGG